ncbi:MAG: type II toxin-antitoxin system death-on-curing family toxin [Verrucomicrobiota bacterium]|nr:type II toxin-antitoxin system death-on-curing family toxin [Verrucomicrobiota bacterium]
MDPEFLSWDEVLHLHERSLAELVARPASAMQERSKRRFINRRTTTSTHALISSASLPLTRFISPRHKPFLDANKRTAIASALTFLELNGIDAKAEPAELHDAMIAIAEKRLDKAALAKLFRQLFG